MFNWFKKEKEFNAKQAMILRDQARERKIKEEFAEIQRLIEWSANHGYTCYDHRLSFFLDKESEKTAEAELDQDKVTYFTHRLEALGFKVEKKTTYYTTITGGTINLKISF